MSGLASLTAHYTDSDNEDSPSFANNGAPDALNRDMQRVLNAPPVAQLRLRNLHNRVEITPNGSTGPLVAYDGHDTDGDQNDEDENNEAIDDDHQSESMVKSVDMQIDNGSYDVIVPRPSSPQAYHRQLLEKGPPVQLPPEPPTKCSDELQSRISDFCDKNKRGLDLLGSIQRKKTFRNPSIYEKLLVHCDIDELGSNFPSEVFDPHAFRKEDYYDELARRQTEAMLKLDKEKKKPDSTTNSTSATTKKSKWDQGGQAAAANAAARGVAAPGLVTMPTGTKSVVISGIGSLPKPKNPVTHVGTSIASRR